MYSRYNNRPERPLRLPENYSGCAFNDRPAPEKEPSARELPRHIDVAKPTPPPEKSTLPTMPPPPRTVVLPPREHSHDSQQAQQQPQQTQTPPPPPEKEKNLSTSLPVFGSLLGGTGEKFPFGHGIGFDELLLIGLIILLSGSEQGSDMILWLALLLFMG